MECYEKFREDKYIVNWHKKVVQLGDGRGAGGEAEVSINIVQLDAAITQMTAIRSIVFQYFVYLEVVCGSFALDSWNTTYSNQWKELDADYITLEFGYITIAVDTALAESECLEVQPAIYVIQAVEDTFFVLQRVLERVLSTGNDDHERNL